jgi:hypothetical protein
MDLFGLSIQQPWVDMITRGVKSVEIRSWEVRRRGLIALHAPWSIDFGAAYFYGYDSPWALARGKIVAVAEIAQVFPLNERTWRESLALHRQPLPLVEGSFGVVLEGVRPLGRPVACRGRQMFFPLPREVSERVLTQVANL